MTNLNVFSNFVAKIYFVQVLRRPAARSADRADSGYAASSPTTVWRHHCCHHRLSTRASFESSIQIEDCVRIFPNS